MSGRQQVPSSRRPSRTTPSSGSRRGRRSRRVVVESGTVEQTLPGLGAPDVPVPGTVMGRAIGLTPNKRLLLVSGRSNPELAQKIGLQIGCQLGEVSLGTFASGETYCRYE